MLPPGEGGLRFADKDMRNFKELLDHVPDST